MIYVLDDDPTVLRAVASALRPCGEIRTASLWSEFGTALVGRAGTDTPTLFVCDLDMPGISGVEFCKIVRRFNAAIPIVIFSASSQRLEAGLADVFVSKAQGLEELRRQVELLLVRARRDTRSVARPAVTAAPAPAPRQARGAARIFVLDDDATVLSAVAQALRAVGEVHATSLWSEIGTALVQGTDERSPTVLVCDLDMPGISGVEFCTIVRRYNKAIPIVVFSASEQPVDRSLVDVVVSKSQGLDELRRQVQRLLRSPAEARPSSRLTPVAELEGRARAHDRA